MIARKAKKETHEFKNNLLETSYSGGYCRPLQTSSSVAQFLSRTRSKNKSFQYLTRNGLELSLSKLLTKSPSTVEQKPAIRPSHSCSKHCKLNSNQMEPEVKLDTICIPSHLHNTSSSIKKPELLEGSRQLSIFSNKKVKKANNIQVSLDTSFASKTIFSKKRDSPTSYSRHPAYSNSSAGDQGAFKEIWKAYTSMKPQRKSGNNRNASRNRTENSILMSEGQNKNRPRRFETEGNSELDSTANFTDKNTAHTAKPDQFKYAKSLTSHFISVIQEINNKKETFSAEDLLKNKIMAAKDKVKEISLVAPHFNDLLDKIFNVLVEAHQDQFVKIKTECDNSKEKYLAEVKQLKDFSLEQQKIVDQLDKERNNQKEQIAKQKAIISELKKQMQSLLEINNTKKAKDDSKKITELMEDVDMLYSENKKLAVIAKKLFSELQKAKKRERNLLSILKNEDILDQEESKGLFIPKLIEVGTKKVQIPVLDFSKLPRKKATKLKVVDYQNPELNSKKQILVLHGDGSEGSEEVFEDSSEEISFSIDDLMENFIQKIGANSKSFSSEIKTH